MTINDDTLRSRLERGVGNSQVPGASVAVLLNGRTSVAATGIANIRAGIDVTPDTVFHIGSITKAFTASLLMQLIDEGRARLSDSLAMHLPELEMDDPDVAHEIDLSQLLSHTSGIDGDRMVDCGRGDDYLQKFVSACQGIGLIHRPGAMFSYCNVGYILLGRIIEKLTGQVYDEVLAERLLGPLGMEHASTLPEDLLLERVAAGHVRGAGGLEPVPLWNRSNTPSGSRLAMSAADLLRFAQMHLAGGRTRDGSRLLSSDSVEQMGSMATDVPYNLRYRAWGLGWMHFALNPQAVFGHDGGVAGMTSFLRIIPEYDAAIALLTNGPGYRVLYQEVLLPLLAEVTCTDGSALPTLPATVTAGDGSVFVGRYERYGLDATVKQEDGTLFLRLGGEFGDPNACWWSLRAIADDSFAAMVEPDGVEITVSFMGRKGGGAPLYLHVQERAYRRATP